MEHLLQYLEGFTTCRVVYNRKATLVVYEKGFTLPSSEPFFGRPSRAEVRGGRKSVLAARVWVVGMTGIGLPALRMACGITRFFHSLYSWDFRGRHYK